MEGLSWDGILGFLGVALGVFGAWIVANWQYTRPRKDALKLYSFTMTEGLDTLLETRFYNQDVSNQLRRDDAPYKVAKKFFLESNKSLEYHRPYLTNKKQKLLLEISKSTNSLIENLHSHNLKIANSEQTPINNIVSSNNNFSKQINDIKKLLNEL